MTPHQDPAQHPASKPDDAASLTTRLRAALQSAAADHRMMQRARHLTARIALAIGDDITLLEIHKGALTVHTAMPLLCPWDFSIMGTTQAWNAYWAPVPAPGWHDLFALAKRGEMRFEGNLLPFLTHLQFLKDLVALPRGGAA